MELSYRVNELIMLSNNTRLLYGLVAMAAMVRLSRAWPCIVYSVSALFGPFQFGPGSCWIPVFAGFGWLPSLRVSFGRRGILTVFMAGYNMLCIIWGLT